MTRKSVKLLHIHQNQQENIQKSRRNTDTTDYCEVLPNDTYSVTQLEEKTKKI